MSCGNSRSSKCNPCGPSADAMNEIANKAAYYARIAQYASDGFSQVYLGAKDTAPTTDNNGNPLIVGALYFNSTNDTMYVWDGTAWDVATNFNENTPFLSTGSTTARTLANRFADIVNVKDFGADPTGVVDCTAAFQAAANVAGTGNPIFVPSGNYLKSTITNESDYFWICNEALNSTGTFPINLIGHVEQAFLNRRLMTKTTTTPNEYTEFQLNKTFNYSGGTPGNVSSVQNVITTVSKNVTNFVWGIVSVLNNSADAGENVAIYGQGNRVANIGPIWGGVFEASDKTNTDGTGKSGTVGIEVDVFANGADVNNNRVGIDVVVGKGVSGGTTCQARVGVRIAPQGLSISNGTWNFGFQALGCVAADFLAQSASTAAFQGFGNNTYGVLLNGTHTIGFDTTTATIGANAIRIKEDQSIAFESTGQIKQFYSPLTATLNINNGSTNRARFFINTSVAEFGQVRPLADNTYLLGGALNRWTEVYAANATINTSDEREKTFLNIEDSEKLAALEIKQNLRKFKFNSAIEKKGENARIHFGASAQQVGDIMKSHNLDPNKYGFYCYDEWDEIQEQKDNDGNIIQEYRAAGNRYGLRYEELLAFIISSL